MWLGSDAQYARTLPLRVPPAAPAPEVVAKPRKHAWNRALPPKLSGRADRALGGAFGNYCWVFGLPATDELRHEVVSGLLGRAVTTWRDKSREHPDGLTDGERLECVTALEIVTHSVDHGFLDYLRAHNTRLGTFSDLRRVACGLLLNIGEPYHPGGEGPQMFAALCHALEEHMDRCDGEHCPLLGAAAALLTERRAA